MLPVAPGEVYRFPDFKLEVHRAKHNTNGGKIFDPDDDIGKNIGFLDHQECDTWGSLESMDFAITINENFRIMVTSGETVWDGQQRIAEAFAPNLVLRQAGRRTSDMFTGQQVAPEVLADLFVSYNAPVIVPGHYDVLLKRWGEEKVREYFAQVDAAVKAKLPSAAVLYPEPGRYYQIGAAVQPE